MVFGRPFVKRSALSYRVVVLSVLSTSVQSGVFFRWRLHPSSRLATIDMNRKLDACPFLGELRPRLATIDMGQKVGRGCALFFWGGSWVHIEHKVARAEGPTSIPSGILVHQAVWPQRTLAENWGLCLFSGGGAGSLSNTMSPGPRPTSVPSGILIHPTIWPQYTNVTDRTGQDRQTTVR